MDEEDLHVGDVIEDPGDASRENHSWGRGARFGCVCESLGYWGRVVGYLAGLGNVKSRNKEGGQSMFPANKFCLIIRKGE